MGYLVGNLIVAGALWVLLEKENIAKIARREAGETGGDGEVKSDEDVRWLFQT